MLEGATARMPAGVLGLGQEDTVGMCQRLYRTCTVRYCRSGLLRGM